MYVVYVMYRSHCENSMDVEIFTLSATTAILTTATVTSAVGIQLGLSPPVLVTLTVSHPTLYHLESVDAMSGGGGAGAGIAMETSGDPGANAVPSSWSGREAAATMAECPVSVDITVKIWKTKKCYKSYMPCASMPPALCP